jgi:hypothetical protein
MIFLICDVCWLVTLYSVQGYLYREEFCEKEHCLQDNFRWQMIKFLNGNLYMIILMVLVKHYFYM